jgi:NADPH2:quinone reductase
MVRQGWHPKLPPLPTTLGCEIAGRIVEVGNGVSPELIGKRAAATITSGGYAEYAIAPSQFLLMLPDDVSEADATNLLVNAPTAFVMIDEVARVQPGQSVLVNAAAGGVGSLLISACKARGASLVIGTASEAKLAAVAATADLAVDYTKADWTDEILAATNGIGVDVVLESVGGKIGTESFSCLRLGGVMVQYGLASREPTQVDPNLVITKGLSYRGFGLPHFPPPRWLQASHDAIALNRAGKLTLTPGAVFPLERAADAHRALESRQTTGKIVLLVQR